MRLYKTLVMALFLSVVVAGCGANSDVAPTADPAATIAIIPFVSSTSPDDGEMGVLTNRKVVATFSEAMDASTITETTFTVKQGTTLVPGAVTYSSVDRTATFTPTNDISRSTVYTATITNEARMATIKIEPSDLGDNTQTVDLTTSTIKAGNTLAADKTWIFTTGGL